MYTRKSNLTQAFLKLERNSSLKKISHIEKQLQEVNISEKDVFAYLQNTNTIDLLKKNKKKFSMIES